MASPSARYKRPRGLGEAMVLEDLTARRPPDTASVAFTDLLFLAPVLFRTQLAAMLSR